jgi:hypothetical protein
MRRVMIGLASASAVAVILAPVPSHAQSFSAKADTQRLPARANNNARTMLRMRGTLPTDRNAPEPASRDAVPPDLDQRRRDGHMTPEERRLLRQHIEDAVRELYKR